MYNNNNLIFSQIVYQFVDLCLRFGYTHLMYCDPIVTYHGEQQ